MLNLGMKMNLGYLFILSEKRFFRTAKQCRQYWINHLDPKPIKTQWKLQEDLQLVKTVIKIGRKWAKVSKIFEGKRTQHMVKNRLKSIIQTYGKQILAEAHSNLDQDELIILIEKKLYSAWITQRNKPNQANQLHKNNQQNNSKPKVVDFSSAEGYAKQMVQLTIDDLAKQQDSMICQEDELLNFNKNQSLTMYSFGQIDEDDLLQLNKSRLNFNKYFSLQENFHL